MNPDAYSLPEMPEQPKPTHEYGTILWPDAEILIRKDDACPRCERVKEVIKKIKEMQKKAYTDDELDENVVECIEYQILPLLQEAMK